MISLELFRVNDHPHSGWLGFYRHGRQKTGARSAPVVAGETGCEAPGLENPIKFRSSETGDASSSNFSLLSSGLFFLTSVTCPLSSYLCLPRRNLIRQRRVFCITPTAVSGGCAPVSTALEPESTSAGWQIPDRRLPPRP